MANPLALTQRSLQFGARQRPRYWWHRMSRTDYVPPIYAVLDDDEWEILDAWFSQTDEDYPGGGGECSVPMMSLLQGIIAGNAIRGVVQCGHYVGYSTLMLGFMFRKMGMPRSLFSVDIDPRVTEYTQGWVDRAGLGDFVHLEVSDSASPHLPAQAREYFDGDVEMVFIDSAHQYEHTVNELDLWYDSLKEGGMLLLHDVSRFAASFDSTNRGGVIRGAAEWASTTGHPMLLLNGFVGPNAGPPGYVPYADGCGVGIVQRPASH